MNELILSRWLVWMGLALLMLLVGIYIGRIWSSLEAHRLTKLLEFARTPLLGFPKPRRGRRGWVPDRWRVWKARAQVGQG